MAANSMDDRVKAGPLGPKWQKLKSRHKALSGKLFAKPDIAAVFDRYDQSLTDYTAERKEEENLKDDIADMLKHAEESSKQIADLTKQLGQITDKWQQEAGKHGDTLMKFASKGGQDSARDLPDLEGHLGDLISTAEEYINKRKQLYDEIDGTALENLNNFKKAQKTLGDKAKAIYDKRLKLLDVAIKAEVEAQSIMRDYIDIANDADHPEIIKDLQAMKFG
jgi:predicted  nucleic acid-binding Zn-ribbon protein